MTIAYTTNSTKGNEMSKSQFKNTMFNVPTSQMILGTMYGGKPNFMALGWVTRVNANPPLFGIGVNKVHATHDAIVETGEFSLSLPSTDMVAITDYTGLISGRKEDKSELFELFYGELKSAPMIKQAPLTLACKLYTSIDFPTNTLFIGELIESWCEDGCLTDGKPDMSIINPFMLAMPENNFWALGEKVGDAWGAGKSLKK